MGEGQNFILVDRIEERLEVLGLSDRKASMLAIGKPDLIRDIRRGRQPIGSRLAALASALQTTIGYLTGTTDNPSSDGPGDGGLRDLVPRSHEMAKDIPVFGTALGAEQEFSTDFSGTVAIEQTDLNSGEVVDRFRRPPNLHERRDIYGLYVAGDSMEPAFESGQGIIVDPKRPPSRRDYVVVYLRRSPEEDGDAAVLIKRLVRRSASYIELQQYNPPATFRLTTQQFREVHRVMPWDEAFGL